jgi:hypothetical protein
MLNFELSIYLCLFLLKIKHSQLNIIYSLASLLAILILAIKSALLCPACASLIFAPIDVPHRKSCFERIYSFFSLQKYL